jgi:hypothetical protein
MKSYILSIPIILAVSFYLVATPILENYTLPIKNAKVLLKSEQIKAQASLDLAKFHYAIAAESKKTAMDEYFKCIADARSDYHDRWRKGCVLEEKKEDCNTLPTTRAKDIEEDFRHGEIVCKDVFYMRMK